MKFLKQIGDLYSKTFNSQAFNPQWWGVFVNPFFIARRGLYRQISICAEKIQGGKLLDIGCGSKPYQSLFRVDKYWGLEIKKDDNCLQSSCDVSYNGTHLPFGNHTIDYVTLNEVLEHVFEPRQLLLEIHRVLKVGGMLLITVPFVWDEHEQPRDFGRYTSFGLQYLLKQNGFSVIYFKRNGCYLNTLAQMASSYLYTITLTKRLWIRVITYTFFCSSIMIIGEILAKLTPLNMNLYLDNIVLAKKKETNSN